jgi:hypothetical protein
MEIKKHTIELLNASKSLYGNDGLELLVSLDGIPTSMSIRVYNGKLTVLVEPTGSSLTYPSNMVIDNYGYPSD